MEEAEEGSNSDPIRSSVPVCGGHQALTVGTGSGSSMEEADSGSFWENVGKCLGF